MQNSGIEISISFHQNLAKYFEAICKGSFSLSKWHIKSANVSNSDWFNRRYYCELMRLTLNRVDSSMCSYQQVDDITNR
jgi:hypothetical protein